MLELFKFRSARVALSLVATLVLLTLAGCGSKSAQQQPAAPQPAAQQPAAQAPAGKQDWAAVEAAGKAEGKVVVFSSMGEEEGIKLWKLFEEKTGIKAEYVRASDSDLMARIITEKRAKTDGWDLLQTTAVVKLPPEWLVPINPPNAAGIAPEAKAKDNRWLGLYANYNAPSYNTEKVKKEDLPKTYEDFLKHPEWKGKIAIDPTDSEWVHAMFDNYGEQQTRDLIKRLRSEMGLALVKGHGDLAEKIGAGEYWFALNNYVNLTLRTKVKGAPTDLWAINPSATFYGQFGVNVAAPRPNAALVAANFLASKEAQEQLTKTGRIPTRSDVATNPPDLLKQFTAYPVIHTGEDDEKWQKIADELLIK